MIRVLGVLRRPSVHAFASIDQVEIRVVDRPSAVADVVKEMNPDVVVVDTAFPGGHAFDVISEVVASHPSVPVLAFTPDPPPYVDVVLATRAGAVGFVHEGTDARELADAITAAASGSLWFPGDDTRAVLDSVAGDLDTSVAERRSRLIGLALGFVPVAGALGAVLSLLWRQYLGHIGVRPVDIAVDPATRVVDLIFAVMTILGIFGPLLFVGRWIELLAATTSGALQRFVTRPLARYVLAFIVLASSSVIYLIGPLVTALVVGPLVSLAIVASVAGLDDTLPAAIRLDRIRPARLFAGGALAIALFLMVLSFEAVLIGPQLGPSGITGRFAPEILGFRAQPVLAFDSSGEGDGREFLYLGGNADLYVLVDPCDDDRVEYVSVGATRLTVIDEITCATSSPDGSDS